MTRFVLAFVALAAIGIAWSEYRSLRLIDRSDPATSLENILDRQPWGGLGSLHAARVLNLRWRTNPDGADQVLSRQLSRYPIDPVIWLLRSTVAFRIDTTPDVRAGHLAVAAATQPGSENVQWQAAMIALRGSDWDLTERHLKLTAVSTPRQTGRALFVAQRWLHDPDTLLDRVVPDSEKHLIEAMRHARNQNNLPLASAIWQRLDHPREPGERVVSDYLGLALNHGAFELVTAAWAELDPEYRPGSLPAGSFHLPIEYMPTFGWSTRMPTGVRLMRETVNPVPWRQAEDEANNNNKSSATLRLIFDGSENIRFRHLSVRFPVLEPGRYQLSGWWRGERLTTRSLPRLEAGLNLSGQRERLEAPSGHFSWQPFTMDLEVTTPMDTLVLRVIRDSTHAFDRYIEGSMWLAALELEKVPLSMLQPLSQIPAPEGSQPGPP